MFSLYTVLLTAHILAVVSWLGASITLQLLARRVAAAGPEGLPAFGEHLDWFGRKWFPAVSGITALLGVLLWIDGPWEFGTTWLHIAVGGWILSGIVGGTQYAPRIERMKEGDHKAFGEFLMVARLDTLLLALIVADMVIKPGS